MKSIKKVLTETGLFSNLDKEKLERLLSKIEEINVEASTLLIHEGEAADCLFIVLEGSAEIFCLDDYKREISLGQVEAGDFFGEQALVSITPGIRNTSVRALTNLNLIKIDHKIYREFEPAGTPIDEKFKKIGFEQLVLKFNKRSVQLNLAKHFFTAEHKYETRNYKPGDAIISIGEVADGVYFLLSGNVEIFKKNESGHEEPVSTLQAGSIFGELGAMRNEVRAATVKALTPVKTKFISSQEFFLLTKNTPGQEKLMSSPKKIYQNEMGEIIQSKDTFLGMPAIISHFYLKNGRHLISSWVENTTLRSIINVQFQDTEIITFLKEPCIRQLYLVQGFLVGVSVFGEWERLDELYKKVIEKSRISAASLEHFKYTGDLELPTTISQELLCNCLGLKKEGHGFGSICGACIKKRAKLL